MRTATWTDSVSVLDRVTAVLDALSEREDGLGVSEIARRANIPKSTASRVAAELVDQGLLERDGDRFSLGVRLFEWGQAVDRPRRLRHLAYPAMIGLRDLTGASVQLAVLDGIDVVFVAVARSAPAVRPYARIGGRLPAHATSVGKAILAVSPTDVVEAVIDGGLARRTPHTITDAEAFRHELMLVRGAGIASEREECVLGRSCVAGVILGPAGDPVAAISVAGATADVLIDAIGTAVRSAAAGLSHRLSAARTE